MPIQRRERAISSERLAEAARSLLDATTLCSIATVASGSRAHVNTAYFAWSARFDIVWMSDPGATHSRNLRLNGSASVAVYDSRQSWGQPDRGVQAFGSARELSGPLREDAERVYANRFPGYDADAFRGYRLYRFRPTRMKLFDERALGAGTFVIAKVRGGRLEWTSTEVYRSA